MKTLVVEPRLAALNKKLAANTTEPTTMEKPVINFLCKPTFKTFVYGKFLVPVRLPTALAEAHRGMDDYDPDDTTPIRRVVNVIFTPDPNKIGHQHGGHYPKIKEIDPASYAKFEAGLVFVEDITLNKLL
jgi:hypothetical protein